MKVLRSRLYQRALEERVAKDAVRAGTKMEIGFGSQIRSYVLAPYRLIKDHRTNFEVGDVDRQFPPGQDGQSGLRTGLDEELRFASPDV